jgi:hypothetical protein
MGGGDNVFALDDEAEDDEPDYDPDHFDRRQVNVWLRRWAARGGKL